MPGHLFLIGFMGSGKSTLATRLARRTGRPSIELDERIERVAGRSIADLFSSDGEIKFRELEKETLATLAREPSSIVATGGGAFLAAENRKEMRDQGWTAWLDVSLEQARDRVGSDPGRPLWKETDSLEFRAFFEKRRACYALAGARVVTTGKTPEAIESELIERFERIFD